MGCRRAAELYRASELCTSAQPGVLGAHPGLPRESLISIRAIRTICRLRVHLGRRVLRPRSNGKDMKGNRIRSQRGVRPQLPALFGASLILFCPAVYAQIPDLREEPVSAIDAYGNVQPTLREWRSINVYQNEAQRDALRGYQTFEQLLGKRGGYVPFALPGDVWSVARRAASGTSEAPSVKSALSPAKQRAFERYGGFGKRQHAADRSAVFMRRYGLIAANSLNAPVYRAISKGGGLVDVRASVARTPFLYSDVAEAEPEAPTLDALLDRGDAGAQQRVAGEAWALFREGKYRRAMRAFESAVTLQPSDAESRIGEVFCYLSVGAGRTALALLGELIRRDVSLFQHDLRLADRYGSVGDVNQLRIQARLSADSAEQSADANALYVFVLWYVGEREDALRAADSLAKRAPAKAYATWPDKMRAARAAESSVNEPR